MLKQGHTWYPLSNIRDMMEIENNHGPISRNAHRALSKHDIFNILFV